MERIFPAESVLKSIGSFEFRKGPYGIYMFKKDVQAAARKYVSVPPNVNLGTLTATAAIQLYQAGLQQKAKAKAYGSKKKE